MSNLKLPTIKGMSKNISGLRSNQERSLDQRQSKEILEAYNNYI